MKLTDQQLRFMDTFGFIKFPGLFSDDIDRITSDFEALWAAHGGGHHGGQHDRKRRSALVPFIDQNEYLASLIDDPRIDGVIGSLLGDDYNYSGSDGNFYVGNTPWHSDGYLPYPGYTSVKMAFYLDPVARDTGCLRVIPGSHRRGDAFADSLQETLVNSMENQCDEHWGLDGSEVPAVALESEPGDLLMFNHRIKHSSWGGSDRRRMFTLNFQQRFRDEDLDELREHISGMARFWVDEPYGEAMLENASPARMVHLEQWLANSDHLPVEAAKARQEMDEPSRG